VKTSNKKFRENSPDESRDIPYGQTDGQNKASSRFSLLKRV